MTQTCTARTEPGVASPTGWQRRVLFVAEGNTMKVEIGQACWPGKIRGRLLESLGAWEKEYGIESVFISPAENPEDPSIGYIWVKGHPERLANAEDGAEGHHRAAVPRCGLRKGSK